MLALKDTLWIRQLLLDLHLLQPGPSMMWCDSKSAVAMAFDPVAFKNTKHILRAAEFLKHHSLCGSVMIAHAKGVIMIADILNKGQKLALSSCSFSSCSMTTQRTAYNRAHGLVRF